MWYEQVIPEMKCLQSQHARQEVCGLKAGGWGKDDLCAAVSLRSRPTNVGGKTFRGKWGCAPCLAVVCISLLEATFCRGGHAPLCSRWSLVLGIAGTAVTQGGQQPGLSFGRKTGLGLDAIRPPVLLWLQSQTDLPPASEQTWIKCKSKSCLGATSKHNKYLYLPWCKCPLQTWIFPFLLPTTALTVWAVAGCSLLTCTTSSIWSHSSLTFFLPGMRMWSALHTQAGQMFSAIHSCPPALLWQREGGRNEWCKEVGEISVWNRVLHTGSGKKRKQKRDLKKSQNRTNLFLLYLFTLKHREGVSM